jgi:alkaline phosphatase
MRYEVERQDDPAGEPSLTEMTRTAIQVLSANRKGFFLMVEAGRIDHGHHDGNAYRALTETLELARAVRAALEMTDARRTLIVVTADHSHALNFIGYPTRGNDILGKVVRNDRYGRPESGWAHDALGLPYTTLGYYAGAGYTGKSAEQPEGIKRYPHHPTGYDGIEAGRPDLTSTKTSDPGYLQETALPLPDAPHSGEDVPVYATGPGAQLLGGVIEQHVVYHVMATALGFER